MSKRDAGQTDRPNVLLDGLSAAEVRRLEGLGRRRERAVEYLRRADDRLLADYIRRARFSALPDGHKTRTLSDGQPHGDADLTLVETQAERLAFAGTEGVADLPDDRTGRKIGEFFQALEDARRACNRVAALITDIRRLSTDREYKSGGMCDACFRDVPGTEEDRLRAGYCEACYRAWVREGRPGNHADFQSRRYAELGASGDNPGDETAGQATDVA